MLWAVLTVGCLLALIVGAGCNKHEVTVRGDARAVLSGSMTDSYQAVLRSGYEDTPPAERTWQQMYMAENFKQWRYFVRATDADATAGPTLKEER